MSRRHHHPDRTPNTEYPKLTQYGEMILAGLEVETRARNLYELTEQQAVDELNKSDKHWPVGQPPVAPIPWEDTDPGTRRDYRLHITACMNEHGELPKGDQ